MKIHFGSIVSVFSVLGFICWFAVVFANWLVALAYFSKTPMFAAYNWALIIASAATAAACALALMVHITATRRDKPFRNLLEMLALAAVQLGVSWAIYDNTAANLPKALLRAHMNESYAIPRAYEAEENDFSVEGEENLTLSLCRVKAKSANEKAHCTVGREVGLSFPLSFTSSHFGNFSSALERDAFVNKTQAVVTGSTMVDTGLGELDPHTGIVSYSMSRALVEFKLGEDKHILAARRCQITDGQVQSECDYAFATELGILSFPSSFEDGFDVALTAKNAWLDLFAQWRCENTACTDRDVARPPFKE